jgi:hypothetical protein
MTGAALFQAAPFFDGKWNTLRVGALLYCAAAGSTKRKK